MSEVAVQYSSRSEFAAKNKPAYEAARVLGVLDEFHDLILNQWTEDAVRAESLKYTSRTEFAKGSGAAYNAARRMGIIESLYESKLTNWTIDRVTEVAERCLNKKDMKCRYTSAYNAALRMGVIDDLFPNSVGSGTRDCVYLWAVNEEPGLYKFGVTSRSMGDRRIRHVAKEAGVTPTLVFLEMVGYDRAKQIEGVMRKLGQPYRFEKQFYGRTEFRYMTPADVETCVRVSRGH